MKTRLAIERDTLGKDAVAGLVLGVESVPDGLAAGLLAGVSPLSGLYAYLFGTVGGSLFTRSTFIEQWRSCTSIRNISASWRTQAALSSAAQLRQGQR
jgi:Sulfate permease family